MKSKKAEEYIDKVSVCYYETCYKDDLCFVSDNEAIKAVELAEEEMKEKAIQAFDRTCSSDCVGLHSCKDCYFRKEFIEELNK